MDNHDTHHGELATDGTVTASYGMRFEPPGLKCEHCHLIFWTRKTSKSPAGRFQSLSSASRMGLAWRERSASVFLPTQRKYRVHVLFAGFADFELVDIDPVVATVPSVSFGSSILAIARRCARTSRGG
jgi:hypothetical protein